MPTAEHHYAHHLGPIYSWLVGDIDAALAMSAAGLDALQLPRQSAGAALDLGAGFGLHALPLAQRGYAVTALEAQQRFILVRSRRAPHPHLLSRVRRRARDGLRSFARARGRALAAAAE